MDVQRTLWFEDNPARFARTDHPIRTILHSCPPIPSALSFRSIDKTLRAAPHAAAEQHGGSKQAEPQQRNLS
jgi:hypothetical protein